MKEKILLTFGIVLLLFGILGLIGVGVAYFSAKPYLDGLPSSLGNVFSASSQNVKDAQFAAKEGASILREVADKAGSSILWWKPFGDVQKDLYSMASSIEKLGKNLQFYSDQIDTLKNLTLGQITTLRLIIDGLFIWLATLHALFIIIGASLFLIRKRLLIK